MEKSPEKGMLEFYSSQAKNYYSRAEKPEIKAEIPAISEINTAPLSGQGRLKVQVTYAYGSLPVSDATVSVKSRKGDIESELYNDVTDSSGIAQNILLPSPDPDSAQDYATKDDFDTTYYVSVFHPGFNPADDIPAKIFSGIETILPVELIKREV